MHMLCEVIILQVVASVYCQVPELVSVVSNLCLED